MVLFKVQRQDRIAALVSPVATHGRLIVDNAEFRWLEAVPHVFSIARLARAVNCDAIGVEVVEMSAPEIDAAAAYGHDYGVKPYASLLTSETGNVPLLLYRIADNRLNRLVLLDGRQRAVKALTVRSRTTAYVVTEADAVLVGRHPASSEIVRLVQKITDPTVLATVKAVLKKHGRQSVFMPIRDILQAHADATDDQALATALRTFDKSGVHKARYKLLNSTGVKPVAFDKTALGDRSSTKHANQIAHRSSDGRPKDGPRENRVKLYYSYFALRLVAAEDIIRMKHVLAPYENNSSLAIGNLFGDEGRSHQRRTESYNAYLRQHWKDMGFHKNHSSKSQKHKRFRKQNYDQYLQFDAVEEQASKTIREASEFDDHAHLREDIAAFVDHHATIKGGVGLREFRDDAVRQFRLMAKAFVRMRQWRPARLQMLDMEAASRDPDPDDVGAAARWDLAGKDTLVSLEDMIVFTELTGVVATDIWPLHLEYNTLFECYALLHGIQHWPRQGLSISPTAIESFLYRARIEAGGENDIFSGHWRNLFAKYAEMPNLTKTLMVSSLRYIDSVKGLDLFERTDVPNGSDFKEQDLSYFLSRLRAT